ncbi:LysE family translocator [Haloferax sp. MBLA0076]|uniref:LysE family translocator n=1 Tax=Haloferax litoreum TaxID=2666140 RepID=A0A6A8GJL3_9EURY|nr:LysE family translocator [Haloferax sp. CBA1148]MRX23019.1 LysE family translocator [Haloferax litoreum]
MLQGIVLGVSIAAPVGPIGVLCIQRTLSKGRPSGFVSGLGAASADAVYGTIAGFGITALSSLLLDYQTAIRLGGGVLLLYLGVQSFRAEPAEAAASTSDVRTLGQDYVSTFLLTITNPVTILAFVGIFAGLGVGISGDYLDATVLVAGVFTGSALWWFALSTGVSLFRTRFTPSVMRRVNQLAGVVIAGFGLVALGSAV